MSDDAPLTTTADQTSYPEIPGYRIERQLGQGGMARVYLAIQESLDRQVAIKVMSRQALTDELSRQRFEQEARTIAKLEHPNIVGIHEVGRTASGQLYYVMPFLANGDLSQRDYGGNEARIAEVLRALLSALEYAHSRGVVHRDVKAENVLFDNADRPLLTDFGIALSKRESVRITTTGLTVGSGGYMPPEQARGEAVDGRADLYSVGILAYELLLGELPFRATDPLALALMHAQDPPPPLPVEFSHWQGFINKALAKSPDDRFRNAQQMLRALERVSSPGLGRMRSSLASLAQRAHDIPWLRAGTAVALGVGISLLAVAMLRPGIDAPPIAISAGSATPALGLPARADPDAPTSEALQALLAQGHEQLARTALTRPDDANAVLTWLQAFEMAPRHPEVVAGVGDTLVALGEQFAKAVAEAREADAQRLHDAARDLATRTGLSTEPVWREYRQGQRSALETALRDAIQRLDHPRGAALTALVAQVDPEHPDLLPLLAAAAELPQRGSPWTDAQGPAVVFLSPAPRAGSPALAIMRNEVTRGDFADFARATRRQPVRCQLRLSLLQLVDRRQWDNPGFPQDDRHPVVCVSWEDARDYANWLSSRHGQRFRLPSQREWNLAAGAGTATCRTARLGCEGVRGTAAIGGHPLGQAGLADIHGNAAEWLSDCADGCSRRLTAGSSWRDPPGRQPGTYGQPQVASRGYDDVGMRLVMEIPTRAAE